MSLNEIDETGYLSLTELTEHSGIPAETVISMVQYTIVQPRGHSPETWEFSFEALSRMQKALRLQHDLELSLSDVALTLDLVEEVDRLKAEIARLEHFVKLHETEN